ncbi:putative cation-transporting P-type ATPase J [Candidatus Protofrankia californiensis]|uniref:Putative cation-transporting P-type ATPase J n=1 Tax=Candidatus Protofrankia californiensis TaxID=1839754 RepID=A0A1C3NYF3_9ACTN|nr:putative cation-transporting P-type ATPase J [Candidatus Protofrankia californiensis]
MWTLAEVRWAAAAVLWFAAAGVTRHAGAPAAVWWGLYLACYACGGWQPAVAGARALRERTLDVDLLMIVAALVAAGIGQVLDGALLIVIFATSGALEAVATHRTADSVRALLTIAPEQALRLRPDGGQELVDTADLRVGDVVLVRPGERIGADGEVTDGASEVDQATITGEPLPVARQPGDEVFAGTLNGTGMLRVRVTRPAAESVLARIVTLVEHASAAKARTQLFIEKVERRYSVGVVGATGVLFVVPLAFGAALQPTLLRAMTFMIVASPCAVVLATMPPLLSAIANAGRHGVLVKSAVVMEQLGQTGVVAFDKTGTLTEGTPYVAEIHPVRNGGLSADELLRLAAGAEHPSEHPLAAAVVAAARERGLSVPPAETFTSTPGRGVSAVVEGHRVQVGNPARMADLHPALCGSSAVEQVTAAVGAAQAAGRTVGVVVVDGVLAGVLALADRARPHAAAAVTALTTLTGRCPVLLTGDNSAAAGCLAAEIGIEEVFAGLLPDDKVTRVRGLQASGQRVLVVGDGVNDAPALAAADLGVAMGRGGSDLAVETADAVIVHDDLSTLPAVIDLSRRARRLVAANLVIAAGFITALVAWDLLGSLPLPLGVAGHEGSTVLVGLNGLRLLHSRAWRTGDHTDTTGTPPACGAMPVRRRQRPTSLDRHR